MKDDRPKKRNLSKYYKNLLSKKKESGSMLESTNVSTEKEEFNSGEVDDRLEQSKATLNRLIEKYFDNDQDLKAVAQKIYEHGDRALKAVADENETDLRALIEEDTSVTSMLEVIVRTDGSRPSFMIREGQIDYDSSLVGGWKGELSMDDNIGQAIKCVGRININDGQHVGTGFLIHKKLVVTNRHVLQAIADEENNWKLKKGAHIDFGYEFRAWQSVNKKNIVNVFFCGKDKIDKRHIDHAKLDMAILEIEPVPENIHPLQWDGSTDWAAKPETRIVIIGYPGDPGIPGIINYTPTLLDQLFKKTYGCKRLSPGETLNARASNNPITIGHDSSTLAGNSGSLIMRLNYEGPPSVCGLHYGGELHDPRENWGHVLGEVEKVIRQTDPKAYDRLCETGVFK